MNQPEKLSAVTTAQCQEFLTFRLGAEEYCIDILNVQEIRSYHAVTSIANTPDFIKGVINLRGQIVPIFDLRIRFGFADAKYDAMTIVIIVNVDGRMNGVVVDSVSDVIAVAADKIKPAPRFGANRNNDFISGMVTVEDRMLIVADVGMLMNSDGLSSLVKMAA